MIGGQGGAKDGHQETSALSVIFDLMHAAAHNGTAHSGLSTHSMSVQ